MANQSQDTHGRSLKTVRQSLVLSLAELQRRMAALGHQISVQRLEQLEYDARVLNVRGQRRLREIAETLRAAARAEGWSEARITTELDDAVLFPMYFAPVTATGEGNLDVLPSPE